MSRPRKRTSPTVGRNRPVTTLTSVVFPAPFGPTMETNSPSLIEKEMSLSALNTPKALETLMVSNRGTVPAVAAGCGCTSCLPSAAREQKFDRAGEALRHEDHQTDQYR